jgi:hypothetical protein
LLVHVVVHPEFVRTQTILAPKWLHHRLDAALADRGRPKCEMFFDRVQDLLPIERPLFYQLRVQRERPILREKPVGPPSFGHHSRGECPA